MTAELKRVMFLSWGRRGAMPQFTFEVARAAIADPHIVPTISISKQNENFDAYHEFGQALFAVNTFHSNSGALFQMWRIPSIRKQLAKRLRKDGIELVVELMPHVWSPFVASVFKNEGVLYATIVHDAVAHPGDPTSKARFLLDRSLSAANIVLTLSNSVAEKLIHDGKVSHSKIRTIFHPNLDYGAQSKTKSLALKEPFKLLFLGRIMSYKGIELFVDAVEILLRENIKIDVGVYGEGFLGKSEDRLNRMNATIVNRWLTKEEIGEALQNYHALVLSHTEASQSGVAAAALGAGLPVVATPVGGLVEQVQDGVNGMLADNVSANALAKAIKRLLLNSDQYHRIRQNILNHSEQKSMANFVRRCVSLTLPSKENTDQ